MPLSCAFKKRILELINNEMDIVDREIAHSESLIAEVSSSDFEDFIIDKRKNDRDKLFDQFNTLLGYRAIIEKETCVE